MTLIGPRPQLVRDMVFMSEEQRMRHTAKPGLSGLAQVSGRNAISWDRKLQYDFSYTSYEEIDENDVTNGVKVTGPKKITKMGMYRYCWPGCLTVMYDAEKIGKIQIADIKKNNDYAMWLKVIKKANCYHYDKVLAQYRKRSGSISNHGYLKLVKWHYKLFKEADNKNSIASLFLTLQNLIYGCWKKVRYVKKVS